MKYTQSFNDREVLAIFKRRMRAERLNGRSAAWEVGISPAALSRFLNGHAGPTPKVLAWLGLKKVRIVRVVYRYIEGGGHKK
jgi:predicted transcriptional regulator